MRINRRDLFKSLAGVPALVAVAPALAKYREVPIPAAPPTTSDLSNVRNLSVTACSPDSVTLTWSPRKTPEIAHYRIYRNHRLIGITKDPESFVDHGAEPGRTYRYNVQAVELADGDSGER